MSTYLVRLMEDTPTQPPSAKVCSTHINGYGAPLNEAYYSSPEVGMSGSIPSLGRSGASTVVPSIKSLGADAGNIGKSNGKAIKDTSDDRCSLLGLSGSVDDKEIFHHGDSLELNDDGGQAQCVYGAIKPEDTAATTQTSNLLHKSCATQARACSEVRIGFGGQILRWRRGSELSYVICDESFPTEASVILVKAAMKTAISMWKGIGVQFKQVDRHDKATFAVIYEDFSDGVYAISFFPKASGGKLVLYEPSLSNTDYLANILAHEVGHILGLRHEFAQERELEPSVLFGRENTNSVMNYFKQLSKYQVTEQDLQELEKFYADDEGELSISDVDPKTRTFSLLSNSQPAPPVNSAAVSATYVSACPFLKHSVVNPAMLYRACILTFVFFMLFMLFIFFVILVLILFV